jgi:hypothetical protein
MWPFTVQTYYSHLFYHYASLCGYHRFIVTGNWMQNSPWSNRAILIISWELRSHICPIGTYFYLKQNTSIRDILSKPIWAMISKLGADYLRGSTLYIDLLSGLFSMLLTVCRFVDQVSFSSQVLHSQRQTQSGGPPAFEGKILENTSV